MVVVDCGFSFFLKRPRKPLFFSGSCVLSYAMTGTRSASSSPSSTCCSNSLEILKKNFERDFSILTTIHSFNEGKAKIDYLRKNGVKNNVILVPYICKKHEVVDPKGNVLVDDYGGNLIGWQASGGVAIRFSNSSQKKYDDFSVVSNLNMAFEIIEQLRID